MRRNIQLLFIGATLLVPTYAQAEDPFAFRVSKAGDLDMTCDALVDEAMLMRDIIGTTASLKTESDLDNHALTAAGTVGSLVVGGITGGLGLAAAGIFASSEIDRSKESAESIQDIANQRRALLFGIYKSKNCDPNQIQAALAPINVQSAFELGQEKLSRAKNHSNSISSASNTITPPYNSE